MNDERSDQKIIQLDVKVAIRIIALIVFVYLLRSVLVFPPLELVQKPTTKEQEEVTSVHVDYTTTSGKPPQFVVFSFDGSKSIDMWKSTTAFAEEMKKKGSPVRFTYFVNAIYFIDPDKKTLYKPPHEAPGSSLIGYAESADDVRARITEVNKATKAGHEIASHAVGHFNGTSWSYDDWMQEFSMFDLLMNEHRTDQAFATSTLLLTKNNVTGFRAPVLGISSNTMKALKDSGFRYDASRIGMPYQWPRKNAQGLWEFPLGTIYISGRRPTISMDYSIYADQTNARDIAQKNSELWRQLYKEVYDSYMNYFTTNYNGNRAPISIGHHFSLWNDGLYWQVMQDIATEVCGKPEVRCVTFSDLADYLDQLPETTLTLLEEGKSLPPPRNVHSTIPVDTKMEMMDSTPLNHE